jgi:hypothetical protein
VGRVLRNNIIIDKTEYDLTHLNPFTIDIQAKAEGAKAYRVLVSFGHHTFTKRFEEGIDPDALIHIEDGERRCFCQDRYTASKGLRSLIYHNRKGKAYFSNKHNFMLIDQPLGGHPYAVFFTLQRERNIQNVDAIMFIISAYEKPNLPAKSSLPSISFATLTHKTVRNERIIRPKK